MIKVTVFALIAMLAVPTLKDYVQYKYKGGDYYDFLDTIGYAEGSKYTSVVRQIAKTL